MTREEVGMALWGIGKSLIEIAGYFDPDAETDEAVPTKPGTEPEAVAAEKPKAIRLEDVRAVLSEISRSGHTAEMKALLEKHGASKLSDVAESEYAALIAEAEEVRNAGRSQ